MMRIKRFLLVNFMLANMLFAGLISQSAYADQIRIPATVCQVWGGDRVYSNYISYSQFGHVENQHISQNVGVVCPVPLHNAPIVDNVRVFYRDRNASNSDEGTFSCRLRSNNIFGMKSNDSQLRSTNIGATNTGNEWHFQDVDTLSTQYEWQANNLTLICMIPPKHNGRVSSLGSIVIDYSEVPSLY